MEVKNRYEGIDEYAFRFIRRKAKQLVGQPGFNKSEREDLEQEMMLDLLQRMPKFNPDLAQQNTFIAHVVDHKVIKIIEARKAGKRDYRLDAYSLNEGKKNEDGRHIEHIQNLDQDGYLLRVGKASHSLEELGELSVDIEKIISDLPQDLRNLCRRLQYETVTEISRDTGIPRTTIYDSIKKLRNMLVKMGFENYFK